MMYVFDTSPLVSMFKNYYPSVFPTMWENFEALIEDGKIVSTREVFREVEDCDDELQEWAKDQKHIFTTPNAAEAGFVAEIYKVTHFQSNIERQKILKGGKNADSFVIAKAAVNEFTVVTMEKYKNNSVKIPNICQHFSVPCISFEDFMLAEKWSF